MGSQVLGSDAISRLRNARRPAKIQLGIYSEVDNFEPHLEDLALAMAQAAARMPTPCDPISLLYFEPARGHEHSHTTLSPELREQFVEKLSLELAILRIDSLG